MKMKRFLGIVTSAVMSILLAGVFYTGWMAVAIPTIKSGFGGLVVKAIPWILAPIVTGFGFALGPRYLICLNRGLIKAAFGRHTKGALLDVR